jgi:hypothetical protein
MSESSRFTQRCRSANCSDERCRRSGRGPANRNGASHLRIPVLIFRTCLIHSTMSSMPPWLHGAPCGMRTGRPYRYRTAIRLESARSGDNEFGRARAFGSPTGLESRLRARGTVNALPIRGACCSCGDRRRCGFCRGDADYAPAGSGRNDGASSVQLDGSLERANRRYSSRTSRT